LAIAGGRLGKVGDGQASNPLHYQYASTNRTVSRTGIVPVPPISVCASGNAFCLRTVSRLEIRSTARVWVGVRDNLDIAMLG
jgi:hypothetical protein